jgi:accessory gene regulator B
MNVIDKAALAIAHSIRRNYSDAASIDVLKFSLGILINTFCAIFISFTICFFTQHFHQVILVTLVLLFIRFISGGIHLNSSLSCCIVSIIILTMLAHIDFQYRVLGFIFDSISCIIFVLRAPNGIQNVSTLDPKYYPFLKFLAVITIFSNLFIQSSMLSALYFIQALIITKTAFSLKKYLERRNLR